MQSRVCCVARCTIQSLRHTPLPTDTPQLVRFMTTRRSRKAMDKLDIAKEASNDPPPELAGADFGQNDQDNRNDQQDASQGAPDGKSGPAKKWTIKLSAPAIVTSPHLRDLKKPQPIGPIPGNRLAAMRREASNGGIPLPSPSATLERSAVAETSDEEEQLFREVQEDMFATCELNIPKEVYEQPGRKKRFAIIFCEDDPAWRDELPRIWTRLLRQPGEEWVLYRLAENGELPSLTEEDDWDGFLIPGSGHSAYEDLPWIHKLKDLIRQCFIPYLSDHNSEEHRLKPQIVGSCFGAQVIAEALGGHVTKNPRGKYCVKAEEIYMQESFVRQPFTEGMIFKTKYGPRFQPKAKMWKSHDESNTLPYLRVTQTHGDSVLTLPADSQVLGSSATITNEIFMVGKNMLAYQSHPEFTWKKHLMKKILPYVLPEKMDPVDYEKAKKSFQQELHSHALIEVTRRFIKREYRDTYDMYHSGSRTDMVSPTPTGEVVQPLAQAHPGI